MKILEYIFWTLLLLTIVLDFFMTLLCKKKYERYKIVFGIMYIILCIFAFVLFLLAITGGI